MAAACVVGNSTPPRDATVRAANRRAYESRALRGATGSPVMPRCVLPTDVHTNPVLSEAQRAAAGMRRCWLGRPHATLPEGVALPKGVSSYAIVESFAAGIGCY
jgi:hypothetical protein